VSLVFFFCSTIGLDLAATRGQFTPEPTFSADSEWLQTSIPVVGFEPADSESEDSGIIGLHFNLIFFVYIERMSS
jgi:hypothetical protein